MWQGRARGPESPLPPPLSEVMVGMGYTREEIKEALSSQKYNEVTATYLLLGRKTEVRRRRGIGIRDAWGGGASRAERTWGRGSLSVLLQEGGDRGAPALALARVRAPSDTTNGTSSGKGTSHSKGQRSASSTYHRQRRHSDFCEYGPPTVRLGHQAADALESTASKRGLSRRDAGTLPGPWGRITNWKGDQTQSRHCLPLTYLTLAFPRLSVPYISVLETNSSCTWRGCRAQPA